MDFILNQLYKKKQYIKFIISGSTAAGVDFGLLFLLHGVLHFGVVVSATIAFGVAFFVSFYLQKFWTFRDDNIKKINKQIFIYLFVGIINLSINAVAIHILVEKYHVWYLFAQAMMGTALSIGSFLMYRFVIFKKKRKIKKIKKKYGETEKQLQITNYKLRIIDTDTIKIKSSKNKIFYFLRVFFLLRKYIYLTERLTIIGFGEHTLPAYMVAKLAGKKVYLSVENLDNLSERQRKIVDGADKVIKI